MVSYQRLIKTSRRILFEHTMQELCVLRDIHSPTFEVEVHFRSSDQKASVDVRMHGMYTVQASVIVDNVVP